ncbi:hypothetical protein AB0D14_24295 [Streptomyces sp. NPDC048484]|uniref:hypothetical protein n=1 Tax=Streptomyces sp. NPDC048484 TaxID=3155146 RepID=UPI00341FBC8F
MGEGRYQASRDRGCEDSVTGDDNSYRRQKSLRLGILEQETGGSGTQSFALNGIAAALYDRETGWTVLRDGLSMAAKGDGSVLLYLSEGLNGRSDDGYSNPNSAFTAVSCAD